MKKAILIVLILSLFTACSKKNDTENAEMTASSSITSEVSEAEEKTAEDVLSETVKTAESSKPLQPTPQEDELDAMLANAFSEDSVFEYKTEDNEIRIEKYNGNSKEAVIPPTINGLPVTKVSVNAFANSSGGGTDVEMPFRISRIAAVRRSPSCGGFSGVNISTT